MKTGKPGTETSNPDYRRWVRHRLHPLERVHDRKTKEPAVEETAQLMEEAPTNRVLGGKVGVFSNVIRISPPLNIRNSGVDEFTSPVTT